MEKEIQGKLLQLPEKIRDAALNILEIEEEFNQTKEFIRNWEVEVLSDISNETDASGKSIYSNETKRAAKLLEMKNENSHYLTLNEQFKELEMKIKKEKIQLEYLLNTQSNLKAMCYILKEK